MKRVNPTQTEAAKVVAFVKQEKETLVELREACRKGAEECLHDAVDLLNVLSRKTQAGTASVDTTQYLTLLSRYNRWFRVQSRFLSTISCNYQRRETKDNDLVSFLSAAVNQIFVIDAFFYKYVDKQPALMSAYLQESLCNMAHNLARAYSILVDNWEDLMTLVLKNDAKD